MKEPLKELSNLFDALVSDVEFLSKSLENEQARRAYIRAVFALVEGLTYGMKQVALKQKHLPWTSAENAILADEAYRLNEKGDAERVNASLTLLPNIKFAFKALTRSYEARFNLSISGRGWPSLQRALVVRNRLMHPKSSGDLSVTKEEVKDVAVAFNWFVSNLALCLRAVVASLSHRAKKPTVLDLDHVEKIYGPFSK